MKSILFVDDEPKLLDGLKRLLRPQRAEWDMFFAGSGEEALSLMERRQVDILVTDMRMPEMDGAELLRRVHERFPGVTRIVLSGQFDDEAGLRATPYAHQFLSKPCDSEKLKAAIARAAGSCQVLPDEATRKIVNAIGALPSPPGVYANLTQAINDPNTSVADVSAIIGRDVALSAKVLQLANSAFFGLAQEVTRVREAISALGMDTLKQLVLSAEILKEFRLPKPVPYFSIDEFEHHSTLSADIAVHLPGRDEGSVRALAALLHDTGKLVLASRLPLQFAEARQISMSENIPGHQAEERVFGTSHAEVGACLLNLWGLPLAITGAIARHHHPAAPAQPSTQLDLSGVIHLASVLAHEKDDHATGPDRLPARLDREFFAQLARPDAIEQWRQIVP